MDDERLFEDWGLCSAFIIQDWTASSSFSLTRGTVQVASRVVTPAGESDPVSESFFTGCFDQTLTFSLHSVPITGYRAGCNIIQF